MNKKSIKKSLAHYAFLLIIHYRMPNNIQNVQCKSK